jgi:penicillin G amidase
MTRLTRGLVRAVIIAGLLILLLAAGAAGLLWSTLPPSTQESHIPGLAAPVAISFDADGIPRIQAANDTDAAAALGFVHARDRMFQMEMMRRAASGRLSEFAGSATLPIDRMMRVLGLRLRAEADLGLMPADTRALLEAYSRGVNAWIALRGRRAAPEFLLLGAPEPWTPVDSLLWGQTMGLWLSSNWRTELSRLALAGKTPQWMIDTLWPPDTDAGHPEAGLPAPRHAEAGPSSGRGSGSDSGPSPGQDAVAEHLLALLPRFPGPFTQPGTASNAWAVDGAHSATGSPLLAGDPHLAFGFPAIWYLARIDTPNTTLAGATAPGVPFMVLGRNRDIAWTFTTTGADTQDVFIETPVGATGTGAGGYATPDGSSPFVVRHEIIKIRGQPDELLIVRETRHGPVISDLDGGSGPILAVSMANLQPGNMAAAGLRALNLARSVADAGRAAPAITAPVQNLMVADRTTIGLFVTGRVPIRRAGDGSAPVQGADGTHDWIGWASGDQLPHVVAPASGHLVNANERIAPPDFPVFLARDWFGDWRARRIRERLAATPRATPADFARMQLDVVSPLARDLLPRLLAVPTADPRVATALDLLRQWDGSMARELPQPLIFTAWLERFVDLVLRGAGIPLANAGPRNEFAAYLLSSRGADQGARQQAQQKARPGAQQGVDQGAQQGVQHGPQQGAQQATPWCGGDCSITLRAALEATVTDLAARFGPDPAAWRWGQPHQAVFANPLLAQLPLIGRWTTFRIESSGGDATIDRGVPARGSFESIHGPEFRAVYDLADLDRSLFVVAPGQSGNPLSSHAADFLRRWRDGETIMLGPNPTPTDTNATLSASIRLLP